MGLGEDLQRITSDPEMLRCAVRRAGNRELAQDAMQETARAILGRKSPDAIENLRGFFYTAMIREIDHQLGRPGAILAADMEVFSDQGQEHGSLSTAPHRAAVQDEVHVRLLAQVVFQRLEHAETLGVVMALVPARSGDPRRYRSAVVSAARALFGLLLEGYVSTADWNAVLKAAYPQWCDESGLARDAIDQRLSRARRDVQCLLRSFLSRDQLAS